MPANSSGLNNKQAYRKARPSEKTSDFSKSCFTLKFYFIIKASQRTGEKKRGVPTKVPHLIRVIFKSYYDLLTPKSVSFILPSRIKILSGLISR
jgi:hypothetical protein